MPTVFLSYRQSDSRETTTKLREVISNHFGEKIVFRDLETIPAGADFRLSIKDALQDCVAMIAVIGSTWLSAADSFGKRRLDDTEDWVRLELESALAKSIPIVPVLVDHGTVPQPEELPSSLLGFAFRNAVPLNVDFDAGIDRLCDDLAMQLWGRNENQHITRSLHASKEIPEGAWLRDEGTNWEAGAIARNNLNFVRLGFLAFCGYVFYVFIRLALNPNKAVANANSPPLSLWDLVFLIGLSGTWLLREVNWLFSKTVIKAFNGYIQVADGVPFLCRMRRVPFESVRRVQINLDSLSFVISIDNSQDVYRTIEFGKVLTSNRRFFLLRVLRRKLRRAQLT